MSGRPAGRSPFTKRRARVWGLMMSHSDVLVQVSVLQPLCVEAAADIIIICGLCWQSCDPCVQPVRATEPEGLWFEPRSDADVFEF